MKQYAHVSVSMGIGLLLMTGFNLSFELGISYLLFALTFFIAGKLNDWLDFKISLQHERRFLTHSPLSPLLIAIAVLGGVPFSFIHPVLWPYISLTLYLIFLTHITMDALNPSGVPVFPGTRFRLSCIPYDDLKVNAGFFLMGMILTIVAFLLFLIT